MLKGPNISPLPFYNSITLQNHRLSYAFGTVCPVIVFNKYLIPFQFCVDSNDGSSISYVRLYNYNTGAYTDITTTLKENQLTVSGVKTDRFLNTYRVVKYPGGFQIPELAYEGFYYLAIKLSSQAIIYYSDVFCNTLTGEHILLSYTNSSNILFTGGEINFDDGFMFRCYINSHLGKPEYKFEEEVSERFGYKFIESQISKKVYKFTFIAPEYLCDALRIVRLCDTKQIAADKVYTLTSFTMEPEWQEQGDLASVECEFETDDVVTKIGGYADNNADYTSHSSFNIDYNNDYN